MGSTGGPYGYALKAWALCALETPYYMGCIAGLMLNLHWNSYG